MAKRQLDEVTRKVCAVLIERFGEPINKKTIRSLKKEAVDAACPQCGKPAAPEEEVNAWYDFRSADRSIDGGEFSGQFEEAPPFCTCQDRGVTESKIGTRKPDKKNAKKDLEEKDDMAEKDPKKKSKHPGTKDDILEPIINEKEKKGPSKKTTKKIAKGEKQWSDKTAWAKKAGFDNPEAGAGWLKKSLDENDGPARVIHVLDRVIRSRDPDARGEALSHCGEYQECSSTGKHSMTRDVSKSTCPTCKKLASANRE